MSKPKTHVAIILDRSGSMGSIRDQAVLNYNEQVQQMKENAKDQEITCSLVTFNANVFEHLWNEGADKLEESTTESFKPNGNTAFYDALGFTIKKLQETTVVEENTAYLVLVISDGEENASATYDQRTVNEMIQACQASGIWTFTYMGCSKNYVERVSRDTGIPMSNCAVWSNRSGQEATSSLRAANASMGNYYQSRTKGFTSSDSVYSCDNEVADFTQEHSVDSLAIHMNNVPNNGCLPLVATPATGHARVGKRSAACSMNALDLDLAAEAVQVQNTGRADVFSSGNRVTL